MIHPQVNPVHQEETATLRIVIVIVIMEKVEAETVIEIEIGIGRVIRKETEIETVTSHRQVDMMKGGGAVLIPPVKETVDIAEIEGVRVRELEMGRNPHHLADHQLHRILLQQQVIYP